MLEAKFNALMDQGRFDEAAAILKAEIVKAEFVNPRDDYSWGIASDILGYRMLEEEGAGAFNAFWEDLLRLFEDDLEPNWGHLHKGHLYFRLGLGNLGDEGLDFRDGLVEWEFLEGEDEIPKGVILGRGLAVDSPDSP